MMGFRHCFHCLSNHYKTFWERLNKCIRKLTFRLILFLSTTRRLIDQLIDIQTIQPKLNSKIDFKPIFRGWTVLVQQLNICIIKFKPKAFQVERDISKRWIIGAIIQFELCRMIQCQFNIRVLMRFKTLHSNCLWQFWWRIIQLMCSKTLAGILNFVHIPKFIGINIHQHCECSFFIHLHQDMNGQIMPTNKWNREQCEYTSNSIKNMITDGIH